MNYEQSVEAYTNYILDHKKNIVKAFEIYGDKLAIALNVDYEKLRDNILVHDESKMEKSEFFCFRNQFYTSDGEVKSKEVFDYGWLLHQNRNMHHPEFWVMRDGDKIKVIDIPNIYIAEMLLDWAGMGIKFGDTAYSYYKKFGHTKQFSKNTKDIVDKVIELLK